MRRALAGLDEPLLADDQAYQVLTGAAR